MSSQLNQDTSITHTRVSLRFASDATLSQCAWIKCTELHKCPKTSEGASDAVKLAKPITRTTFACIRMCVCVSVCAHVCACVCCVERREIHIVCVPSVRLQYAHPSRSLVCTARVCACVVSVYRKGTCEQEQGFDIVRLPQH